MSQLHERVLTDKGFVNVTKEQGEDAHVVIAKLSGKVEQLSKKLKDAQEFFQNQRDGELVKIKDENAELKKQVNKMRRDIEALNKRLKEK